MNSKSFELAPKKGSRILIAGGAGGIGQELVSSCLDAELIPVVLDLRASIEANLHNVCESIAFDGSDQTSIDDAMQDVGRLSEKLDGFVFLSGFPILPRRPLSEVAVEQWEDLMSVNLRSAFLLFRRALPYLMRSEAPSVVTVASSLAYQVMPGMGAYAASKGGLISLTKAFAMENAPKLRANIVAPGAVDTNFLGGGTGRDAHSDRSWFDKLSANYISTIPLGRVAEPKDVIGPILFLLGQASAYLTGQVIHVNGGRLTP